VRETPSEPPPANHPTAHVNPPARPTRDRADDPMGPTPTPTPTAAQPHIWAHPRSPWAGIDVAGELRRPMPRDRWLLELLHEQPGVHHRTVAALGFDHIHTARNRLVLLNKRGILARFRDSVRPGSQQWRWTLDLIGAAYLAARNGEPEPQAAVIRRRITASRPGRAWPTGSASTASSWTSSRTPATQHTPGSACAIARIETAQTPSTILCAAEYGDLAEHPSAFAACVLMSYTGRDRPARRRYCRRSRLAS
jgi:Replication-relaxation